MSVVYSSVKSIYALNYYLLFQVNSSIDGSILMKSFLSGNPELRLALNEDLVIGKGGAYGSVQTNTYMHTYIHTYMHSIFE